MWPMLLDYSDDECKRILRKLELEAYASIISAFRAQGELSKDKKKMLQELSIALSISIDRHRAEIRRAVNDEHLNTIADRIAGPNTITDWAIEGRRVIPLMSRMIPHTAYTVIANYAADAQAARNATLPVPSATGLKGCLDINEIDSNQLDVVEKSSFQSEISENGEPSRKRCSSPETSVIPEKMTILERHVIPSGSGSGTDNNSEGSNDPLIHCSSPIPRCVMQSVLGKDAGSIPKAYTPQSAVSTNNSMLIQPAKFVISTASSQLPSSGSTPFGMSLAKPSPSSGSTTGMPYSKNSSTIGSLINTLESSIAMGEIMPTVPVSTTSLSYPSGATQSVKMLQNPVSSSFNSKTQTKVTNSAKALMRPRLSPACAPSQTTFPNFSTSLTPSPAQTFHKNVSPIKFRSSINNNPQPSVSTSIVTSSPNTTVSQIIPRPPSPAVSLVKVAVPSTVVQQIPSPIVQKSIQPSITVTKPTVGTKIIAKPTAIRPALNTKPVVTTVTKSAAIKTPITISTAQVRQPLPLSVKTSFPAQMFGTNKSSATITYSQKLVPGTNQLKSTGQAIAKTIHYRSEGGLKIISQNLPTNRILPKPPVTLSPQSSMGSSVRLATTNAAALTGNARIVNFTQPISARFARALPPSSVAAVNIPSNVSGLRVALPVGMGNSQVVRSTIPAKPNVIVVHKAQVWPQTPGGTIVMTSTGSLSRLSNEAIEEAVTIMQRQDVGRHTGTSSGFKTLTVHHGSSFTSTPSTIVHSKMNPSITRKVLEVPTSESVAGKSAEPQRTEQKSKLLKSDTNPTPVLLSENQKDSTAMQKKDANSSVKPIVALAQIVMPTVEKNADTSVVNKTLKISEAEESAKVSSTISNEEKCQTSKQVVFPKDQFSAAKKNTVLPSSDTGSGPSLQKNVVDESSRENLIQVVAQIKTTEKPEVPSSKVSIPDFNLEQLQEGEVIELQAQDAAELLSHHGQLSTEVIELLQQAGLQVEIGDEDSNLKGISSEGKSSQRETSSSEKPESVSEISSSDKTSDLKSDSTETPNVIGESDLLDIDEPCDSQNQESPEDKSYSADLFLKSDTESQCNEDIFLAPVDSSDAEGSNSVSHISKEEELTSLQATESLGDSPSSQSSLGSLNPNNVTVEIEDLDGGNTLLPDNSVS